MASVRFKFRSSATFDTVEIGDQSSISIRDLKSLIILKNHLNLSHDFDLVFSDSISGQEYKDENTRIASGSSVIIKRVPPKSSPSRRAFDTSAGCFGIRDAGCVNVIDPPAADVGANDYDDFGIDLSPPLPSNFSDMEKVLSNDSRKKDDVVPRCSQDVLVRCPKLEAAPPIQSAPKESSANEGSTLVLSKPKTEEQIELERTSPARHLNMKNSDIPSEMKCSLCRTYFKEAVMLPCCQHSFCAKCIRTALLENAKCPKCSSMRCKPEDLLPNVSLRQAIERFLESQMLLSGSENDVHRYAPDGESGIQVKDISCSTAAPHRHLQLKQSAAWNGSNQIRQSKLNDCVHPSDKLDPEPLEELSEFQGENEPQNLAGTNEYDSNSKKGEGSHVVTRGGERNLVASGRPNRGPRTCYGCGSPDHLIKDCPVAANSLSNHWSGVTPQPGPVSSYPPPYWPGNPQHAGPFMNMYGAPGMMFYNSPTAPISPCAFPCAPPMYGAPMYGGYPVSGYMSVGGMPLPAASIAQQPRQVEPPEFPSAAKQQRSYDEYLGREGVSNRDQNTNVRHDYAEQGPYHSGDSFGRRSEGKHKSQDKSDVETYSVCNKQGRTAHHLEYGRDVRISQSDRSSSEKDMLDNRFQPREDKREQLYRTARRNDEVKRQHGCDSIHKHYPSNNRSSKRTRTEHDERKSDRHSHSHSRSSLEPSYSSDGLRHRREAASHRSLHSYKIAKVYGKEVHHDRGKTKYLDDYSDDYHSHKRKRYH